MTGLPFAAVGVVLVVVAWLGAAGRLRRNWVVGIRLPSTMHSDEAWRAAHRAGSSAMAYAGLVAIAGGLAEAFSHGTVATVIAGAVGLVVLALVLLAAYRGVRAARTI